MTQLEPHAVVLDPFSSGRFLVDEFERRGIPCVAVLSSGIPALFASSFAPERYAAVIAAGDSLDRLVEMLRPYRPLCVMTGIETGIAWMDRLAARFGLPGNDPAGSTLRRDKYLMQEAIRARGLRAARQCRVEDADSALAWLEGHGRFPVVVKPAASAGSDNIHVCGSAAEVRAAVQRILDADNLFGTRNTQALVQEYLEGQEWVVDTVCRDGRCVVTNVTRYKKIPNAQGSTVYRHSAFLSPDRQAHGALIDYAERVVHALGIRHGAAHTELIVTAEGPVLVEVNARMHGGDAVSVLGQFAPCTQLDLSVDAAVVTATSARKPGIALAYSSHVLAHFLISRAAGTVRSVMGPDELARIGSYAGDHMPAVGARLVVTDSLTSAPGYIWLAHAREGQLLEDQRTLVAWEEAGLLYS